MRCHFIENFFAGGYVADPLADIFWKLFNDVGWMVGFGVDVDRVVVRFVVGFVGISLEVVCDIKEVDFFQVGLALPPHKHIFIQ